MLDVNMIIANNIQAELKKENKKQVDLAEGIGVSKQTMSKIMNGVRAINAIELHKISEYLHVSMEYLMKIPEKPMDTNVIHAFMGRVKTEEARKGIQLADKLSGQGQESDFVHAAHGDSSFRFYDHIDRLHKLEIGYAYRDDVMAIVGDTLSDGTELEPCSFYKGNSGRSRLIAI